LELSRSYTAGVESKRIVLFLANALSAQNTESWVQDVLDLKRAIWLQETRAMKFQQTQSDWEIGRLTQEEKRR
jgi:hypothetical protein